MRLLGARFTLRRLMLHVAIVAVVLAVGVGLARRFMVRSRAALLMAQRHANEVTASKAAIRLLHMQPGPIDEVAISRQLARQIHHQRLQQQWEKAAATPSLLVESAPAP